MSRDEVLKAVMRSSQLKADTVMTLCGDLAEMLIVTGLLTYFIASKSVGIAILVLATIAEVTSYLNEWVSIGTSYKSLKRAAYKVKLNGAKYFVVIADPKLVEYTNYVGTLKLWSGGEPINLGWDIYSKIRAVCSNEELAYIILTEAELKSISEQNDREVAVGVVV